MKKIKPTQLNKKSLIHTEVRADNETLRFSFKHLSLNNKKFSIQGKNVSVINSREPQNSPEIFLQLAVQEKAA